MKIALIILGYLFIGSNFVRYYYLDDPNDFDNVILFLLLWPFIILAELFLMFKSKTGFIVSYFNSLVKKRNAIDFILYLIELYYERKEDKNC